MAKLPLKKSGAPVRASRKLGMSKARPKNNSKKNVIKNDAPTGSSPKPTKTTGSKDQHTQIEKKENQSSKPAETKKGKKKGGRKKAKLEIQRQHRLTKSIFRNALEKKKDKKLTKKFANDVTETPKGKKVKVTKVDPTQLINLKMVETAVSGVRKLPSNGKIERKSLHDITDEDERFVYLQVTLCKLPNVTHNFHLSGPTTVSVYLPHSLVTDNTDVILLTKDLQRGIKRDHQSTLNHFKELLHHHGATSLVNEIIPLRQLKVEYREFEAKRLLANRTEMLLCDDTVIRFIPKFLTKHFYTKKKLPVQVNLKAKDLQKELLRALAVSRLFFSMKGNSSILKIGRMSQTDDEIQENVLAAVGKLASHAPGKWDNIQSLSLKLERTTSIPIYVKIDSMNNVKSVPAKPVFPGEVVSGTLSTQPGRCITVFPDGSITATRIAKKDKRLTEEKAADSKAKEPESKGSKRGKRGKKSTTSESNVELPETKTEVSSIKKEANENSTKRKASEKKSSKVKKQKKAHGSDSDSDFGEDDLEEQELMYLRQLNQDKNESAGNQEEEEDSEDVWGDSGSDMEESD